MLLGSSLVFGIGPAHAQNCVPPTISPKTNLYGNAHGGFDRVHQLTRRSDGRIYVADGYQHRVRVYASSGTYLESIGSTGSGLGQFNVVGGLVFDHDSNLYVAEQANQRIQKFSPTHVPLMTFGSPGSGPGQLDYPTNLAISPDGTRLYVVELFNHRVSMFDPSGNFLGSFGSFGPDPGQLNLPFGIVVDGAGDVWVAAGLNHNVAHYDALGNFIGVIGAFGTDPGQFNNPVGLGLDEDENLYVTDQLNNRVHKMTRSGVPLEVFGSLGGGLGQMVNPWAVLPLPDGTIWVGDTFNYRVSIYDVSTPSPQIMTIADVADDDGHQVRIRFVASSRDRGGSPTPILQYEAYRRIDETTAAPEAANGALAPAGEAGSPARWADLAGWEFVGAIPAHAESEYNMIVPTLQDSKPTKIHYATFFVRAATSQPATYFDACPDSGASHDNHGPPTPGGFRVASTSVAGDVSLAWEASTANDFDHFELHRGDDLYFTPSAANKVADLVDTELVDAGAALGAPRFYKLAAVDHAENLSAYAEVTAAPPPLDAPRGGAPLTFALHPIEPNPSAGVMTARFDLPLDDVVTMRVFDLNGRQVRAVGERAAMPAGRHHWTWDGLDAGGARSPVGMYFVRVETPHFSRTRAVVRVEQ